MAKIFSFGFWNSIARLILRNRIIILLLIIATTVFFASQWKNMRFSFTEANLLPDDHQDNIAYNEFLDKFGEEGNVVLLGIQDSALFEPENFQAWKKLTHTLESSPAVDFTISLSNLQQLKKFEDPSRFEMVPFISEEKPTKEALQQYQDKLYNQLPFYENLVYSSHSNTVQSAIYMNKEIVNSKERKTFIIDELQPLILNFEENTGIDVKVSGMPYIRTLNSQNIIDEIELFILAALAVTSLIFFFFFRSIRATIISMITVCIGVMWAFGVIGFLHYEITVLTALIPPLIIVIGIPNCIFLINKYQQEIKKHGNQAKSLQRVITKVGNATLMTNITTASGFATFILTDSTLLKEFGIVASINIVAIFILSLLIIPIIYSYMNLPKYKHLKHLNKRWIGGFVNWMEQMVRHHRISIYITSIILLVASIIGIYTIKISGSLLEDMPEEAAFFQDIKFFEKEFDGVMPLEILVDTKRKNGVLKLATLKRMEELQNHLAEIPEFSQPISVTRLVKYSKQAFYNGEAKYYQLPSSQEQNFIMPYAKGFSSGENLLSSYVDSTGRYARITTYMKDIGTDKMEDLEEDLWPKINKIFPEERYEVSMTGKALIFQKGTNYLVKNLVLSLSLAILLIALLMAWMFRSFRMIIVSLVPNLLPLLVTAGMMGFLGVPIKPSTILVFSIAFGISVDDTIHFLAKYRQELKANNWKIKRSVYGALRETGVSMFYTSIVLFFGFSVFMISSFGGTVALGGLVSATLLFAMLANLLLLPSLLLSLEKNIANKKVLKEPAMKIIDTEEDEDEIEKETSKSSKR
ncbi:MULTISPECIES: efflux RND transporter permease subunit [Salegentibacter]|uniref:MMPL family transporter n=1 Tax=Salegentibacter maritimus TaxID=2794347 RepID=A0ABS0TI29_9FLAO|nr:MULTISPECIES: efflux RND transporter permease subunit [Salegentibacter]MBE7639472.1 MMPL family transporter [Salegentibacter sp. BLCTC]MBI6116299.1 MMPL family transporter [Salegentibacter maritimus]MBI6120676.1 MMPL family transporter [Salegentibacter maritimus]